MNADNFPDSAHLSPLFYPAIVRDRFVSPIDALVALGIPGDESTDLVIASWHTSATDRRVPSIVATTYGGRPVAVVPLADGRWAACNIFLDTLCATAQEAERRLDRLLKPGTRGTACVLTLQAGLFSLV